MAEFIASTINGTVGAAIWMGDFEINPRAGQIANNGAIVLETNNGSYGQSVSKFLTPLGQLIFSINGAHSAGSRQAIMEALTARLGLEVIEATSVQISGPVQYRVTKYLDGSTLPEVFMTDPRQMIPSQLVYDIWENLELPPVSFGVKNNPLIKR